MRHARLARIHFKSCRPPRTLARELAILLRVENAARLQRHPRRIDETLEVNSLMYVHDERPILVLAASA